MTTTHQGTATVPNRSNSEELLLEVRDLKVSFPKAHGRMLPVIDTASLLLHVDEALGVVGESGSGKTMLCRTMLGTLERHGARAHGGRVVVNGRDYLNAAESDWRRIRGRVIGYVPQSSLAGLNPVLTIGTQLVESIVAVRPTGQREARREALELLEMVHIPRAASVLEDRPHQLSGGMRQRVMIASALAQRPKILVADEPTTALDVTTQREILTLLGKLRRELGMALILVSHDLAVIEEVCDSVMVMYAGASVEMGPAQDLHSHPRHPYTRALRVSRVDTAQPGKDLETIPGEAVCVGVWPAGCRFAPRCSMAIDPCRAADQPGLQPTGCHMSACLRAADMEALR